MMVVFCVFARLSFVYLHAHVHEGFKSARRTRDSLLWETDREHDNKHAKRPYGILRITGGMPRKRGKQTECRGQDYTV
jgi:hypothetical protein